MCHSFRFLEYGIRHPDHIPALLQEGATWINEHQEEILIGAAYAVATEIALAEIGAVLAAELFGAGGSRLIVRSEGRANNATAPLLSEELLARELADPMLGRTLSGATGEITVTARGSINGRPLAFFETNQTARPLSFANPNDRTLVADLINPGNPNSSMANAHAEVALMQRAYNAGLTQGADMSLVVRGRRVCGFCQTNLYNMADRSGLNSLRVADTQGNLLLTWTRESGAARPRPLH